MITLLKYSDTEFIRLKSKYKLFSNSFMNEYVAYWFSILNIYSDNNDFMEYFIDDRSFHLYQLCGDSKLYYTNEFNFFNGSINPNNFEKDLISKFKNSFVEFNDNKFTKNDNIFNNDVFKRNGMYNKIYVSTHIDIPKNIKIHNVN